MMSRTADTPGPVVRRFPLWARPAGTEEQWRFFQTYRLEDQPPALSRLLGPHQGVLANIARHCRVVRVRLTWRGDGYRWTR